jgi:hypothetical protein
VSKEINWRELYTAAILEFNPVELLQKISVAEAAMQARLEQLASAADPASIDEQRAIADARQALAVLTRVEVKSVSTSHSPSTPANF